MHLVADCSGSRHDAVLHADACSVHSRRRRWVLATGSYVLLVLQRVWSSGGLQVYKLAMEPRRANRRMFVTLIHDRN